MANNLLDRSKKMRKSDVTAIENIDKMISEHINDAAEFEIATLKEFKLKGKTQPFKVDGEKLALLKESMDKFGQITPIAIRENSKGKLEVFSGLTRLRAAKELGWTTLKGVNFGKLTDKETFEMLKNANIQRDKPLPSELARLVDMSKSGNSDDEKELSVSDISKLYGVSRKHIYRCYKILDLNPILHDLIDREYISTAQIEKIAANLGNDQQEVLGNYIITRDNDKDKKLNGRRFNILLDKSEEEFTVEKIEYWFSPDYKPQDDYKIDLAARPGTKATMKARTRAQTSQRAMTNSLQSLEIVLLSLPSMTRTSLRPTSIILSLLTLTRRTGPKHRRMILFNLKDKKRRLTSFVERLVYWRYIQWLRNFTHSAQTNTLTI